MNDNSESATSVVEFGVGHELPGDVVWSSETQDEPPSVPSVSAKKYILVKSLSAWFKVVLPRTFVMWGENRKGKLVNFGKVSSPSYLIF